MNKFTVIYSINDRVYELTLSTANKAIANGIIDIDYIKRKVSNTLVLELTDGKETPQTVITKNLILDSLYNSIHIRKVILQK